MYILPVAPFLVKTKWYHVSVEKVIPVVSKSLVLPDVPLCLTLTLPLRKSISKFWEEAEPLDHNSRVAVPPSLNQMDIEKVEALAKVDTVPTDIESLVCQTTHYNYWFRRDLLHRKLYLLSLDLM